MKSLNEVYKENELYYWCNAVGEINIPSAPLMYCGHVDDLPPKIKELYNENWNEGCGYYTYVVSYRGHPGMALSILFDKDYMAGVLNKTEESFSEDDSNSFFSCICKYTEGLEKSPACKGLEFLVGNNTDPDGHELLVIVPYEYRNRLDIPAGILANDVYRGVENLAKAKPNYVLMFNTAAAIEKMPNYRRDWHEQLIDDFIRAIHGKAYHLNNASELWYRFAFIIGKRLLTNVTESDVVDLYDDSYGRRTEPVKLWDFPQGRVDFDAVLEKIKETGFCIIPFRDFYSNQQTLLRKRFSGCYIEIFACDEEEEEGV